MSELEIGEDYVKEVKRDRIEAPNDKTSYCEKNWTPVKGLDNTFIKWSNPTEVVEIDISNNSSKTIYQSDKYIEVPRDLRGGSQLIKWDNDTYLSILHECKFVPKNQNGFKDGDYYHRFILWNLDWTIKTLTAPFNFMTARTEFCIGLEKIDNDVIMVFGFQDNGTYAVKTTVNLINNLIDNNIDEKILDDKNKVSLLISKKTNKLESRLQNLIYDPKCYMKNLLLGYEYEKIKQNAIALSYYLRCAEYSNNPNITCEALIRGSFVIGRQQGRDSKEIQMIRHAISVLPDSLEANLIWSKFYSWRGQWLKGYVAACNGLDKLKDNESSRFILEKIYNDESDLLLQKGLCGQEIGKINESRHIYIDLLRNPKYSYDDFTCNTIKKYYNKLPEPFHEPMYFKESKKEHLRYKFENYDIIDVNSSQVYQDMFILSILNGKKNGTYLEIGGGHYKNGNNTYLLETKFDWQGNSIDFDKNLANNFNNNRKNICLCEDATKIDYEKLLKNMNLENSIVDYIQLDCDPANITYDILLKIPFDKYKFRVITYEHDYYNDTTGIYRDKSREHLRNMGYILIAGNISSFKNECPFEDWWIHPELVDENIYTKFKRDTNKPINGEEYMLSDGTEDIKETKSLLTFGCDKLFKNQKTRLVREAKKLDFFDEYHVETPETVNDLLKDHMDFVKNNPRGYGYWIWKPMIIEKYLNNMKEGDVLFYLDAGSSIIENNEDRMEFYVDILQTHDVIVFDENQMFMNKFIKMTVIKEFGLENSDIINSSIIEGGCVIVKKSDYSLKFIKEWKEYLIKDNYKLVNDNLYGEKQLDTFSEHRHDQAVLGILSRKSKRVKVCDGLFEVYHRGPIFHSRMTDNGPREWAKPVPVFDNKKNNNLKIIDCFTFYNELDLLNYRLEVLNEYVDYFVLVEATHTHVGNEKKMYFKENKDKFKKFENKIIHIIVDDFPHKHPNIDINKYHQWLNERFQRECIERGINTLSLKNKDVILISDLDEIPNPKLLGKVKNNEIKITKYNLFMDTYYYNLNNKKISNKCCECKILTYFEYKNLNITCHEIRRLTNKIETLVNGGWHLSYFVDSNFIKNKIKNFDL